MSVFLRIDLNIFAMVLLGTVFLIAARRLDRKDSLNRAFMRISVFIILQLFIETSTCVINGLPGRWVAPVSDVLHIVLFAAAPFLSCLWFIFVINMVGGKKPTSIRKRIIFIPIIINAVLAVLSPRYGLIFHIDSANIYHRGPLFPLCAVLTYFYLLHGLLLIIRRRKALIWQEYILLQAFAVLPLIGGLAQSLFYGLLLMWSCSAFALVIVYIYLQQRMVQLDSLTGAWSRNSLESYILTNIRHGTSKKRGVIYVDIDGLKNINDKYGHVEGDHAIRKLVDIIKSVTKRNDFIVRMGGDEFLVVLGSASQGYLDSTVERIRFSLSEYNRNSRKKYRLECSLGADIFDSAGNDLEDFINHIDMLMYEDKKLKYCR